MSEGASGRKQDPLMVALVVKALGRRCYIEGVNDRRQLRRRGTYLLYSVAPTM